MSPRARSPQVTAKSSQNAASFVREPSFRTMAAVPCHTASISACGS